MHLHGRAFAPSPVQLFTVDAAATAGHRYTRRSRRPTVAEPGRLGMVTVSHILAVEERGRVTRPTTSPAHRDLAS